MAIQEAVDIPSHFEAAGYAKTEIFYLSDWPVLLSPFVANLAMKKKSLGRIQKTSIAHES